MKYMGSKRRIAGQFLHIVLQNRKPGQYYVEPFVGGANVIDKVGGLRIAGDSNEYLIAMWKAFQKGWQPPIEVSEEFYNQIKANKSKFDPALVGFVGVNLTFGSTWFGTYARNNKGTNFAIEGRLNLLKQVKRLREVNFNHCNYWELDIPKKSIIYCDPPYANTAGYANDFDSLKFWQWAREKSINGNKVFISEYVAPQDFKPVWVAGLKTNMKANSTTRTAETVFVHESQFTDQKYTLF